MRKVIQTLSYIVKDRKVLLGYKKIGFGQGRWNGFGGKVEAGEEIVAGATRELKEECGVTQKHLTAFGKLEFKFVDKPDEILETYLFRAEEFSGEPQESNEMRPEWFSFADVPYDQMWDDDQYWFSQLLAGKKVNGSFLFDEHDKVIEKEINFI